MLAGAEDIGRIIDGCCNCDADWLPTVNCITQLVEQRLGKGRREPAIDRSEQTPSFGAFALVTPGEAGGGAEFKELCSWLIMPARRKLTSAFVLSAVTRSSFPRSRCTSASSRPRRAC